MDPAPPSRERLLHAAASAGDAAAWEELFRDHHEAVFRYAVWRCGGRPDLAEDVTQEAWLLAAKRLRAFDPTRGSFAGWVCGLAANVARNAVRTRLRHARRLNGVTVPSAGGPEHDPELVALALAELSPEQEAVLRGKYFDGLSVDELAATTGRSSKAVESQLTRARAAFRAAYRRLGGGQA
jgi:RNA polymerase sigma-70 factor (ECF subfamily)